MKHTPTPKMPKLDSQRTKERIARAKAVLPPVPARFKKQTLQQQTEQALQNVPRITNETVAEHRETVLRGARKYKYPLEHSKRKIITISLSLLVAAIVGFIVYSVVNLYSLQTTSNLMYRVTQIIPFPVAKAGKQWISYENYLFELRRYMHYYETQQQVDFTSESGKLQLASQKPKAMDQVIEAAYVKQLAQQKNISVSEQEVQTQLNNLRAKSQLSEGDKELEGIVRRFYGWSLQDLKREIRSNLLAQKVSIAFDTETATLAEQVLAQARSGADFAALAAQYSVDENTKANGGQYNDSAIGLTSQEVPIEVVRALEGLQPGGISDLVRTPMGYEIVKLLAIENGKYKAAHIQINTKPVTTFVDPLANEQPPKKFIDIPANQTPPNSTEAGN